MGGGLVVEQLSQADDGVRHLAFGNSFHCSPRSRTGLRCRIASMLGCEDFCAMRGAESCGTPLSASVSGGRHDWLSLGGGQSTARQFTNRRTPTRQFHGFRRERQRPASRPQPRDVRIVFTTQVRSACQTTGWNTPCSAACCTAAAPGWLHPIKTDRIAPESPSMG